MLRKYINAQHLKMTVKLKYIQHRCRTGNLISVLVILITVFIRVRFKINDKVRNKNNT